MITYPVKMDDKVHEEIKGYSEDTGTSMKELFIAGAIEYGKRLKKAIESMKKG